MTWDGATPTAKFDDVTPVQRDRCTCGQELIMIDGDEKPPVTKEEQAMQFHCLSSRAGDWRYCQTHNETWVKVVTK